ncbi:hypothetical protein J7E97_07850 [Streptomyces sp. ISL-66]|uniref:hypothetical protein n=1 Tax=Streptomyces sp. ISL-66 TaxID=2819186 RepID=UPI001BE8C453|nr:hypothetical protein [Streptomyces sp. ISL-66]MBT2467786.1 hypothetical protein [Streptomyces sp. ISL-66]
MSAPMEPRPAADLVQDALAAADVEFRKLFGPPAEWSEAVLREYRLDQHIARQRATNWGEAA